MFYGTEITEHSSSRNNGKLVTWSAPRLPQFTLQTVHMSQ